MEIGIVAKEGVWGGKTGSICHIAFSRVLQC